MTPYSPQYLFYYFLLSLVAGFPLLLLIGVCFRSLRPSSYRLLPLAPVPALLAVLFSDPGIAVQVPWFFMGSGMELDATGRIFLALTGLIWLFSALAVHDKFRSDPHRFRFAGFFLAAMSGNFGLILARDILGFYLFFALMSFSAYGLIVHHGTGQARKAGRIYLILVLLSELAMFTALVILTGQGSTSSAGVLTAGNLSLLLTILLYIAFGVKVGALPFQSWMLLSYQEIPVPAATALAGAMVNAGLLGWLRFFSLGQTFLPNEGTLLILLGALASLYGVVCGLYQKQIGRVLASSSISQMGLVTLIAGYGLKSLEGGKAAAVLVTLFAVHHSLAKTSLFLGYDLVDRRKKINLGLLLAGLLLPSLALAGLPFTSGAIVKGALKELAALDKGPWYQFGKVFLPISSIGTTVLMLHCVRLLILQSRGAAAEKKNLSFMLWLVSVVSLLLVPWMWPPLQKLGHQALQLHHLLQGLWPVALGTAAALAWIATGRRIPARELNVADFDEISRRSYGQFMNLLGSATRMLDSVQQQLQPESVKQYLAPIFTRIKGPGKWEKVLGRWSVVGLCYLLICIMFFLIMLTSFISPVGT